MQKYMSGLHTQRVGLMGGTFDPIHYGHLVVAEEVRATLNLASLVFLPAGQPPHKQGAIVSEVEHRLAMLRLAIASNPHFDISLVDIERAGPSYTVDTLRLLRQQWGAGKELYLIIGWDSLEELATWHQPEQILQQLSALVAVHRPGYTAEPADRARLAQQLPGLQRCLIAMPAPQYAISATDIRRRVTEGRPLKYQVPEPVEQYILQRGLYRHHNV